MRLTSWESNYPCRSYRNSAGVRLTSRCQSKPLDVHCNLDARNTPSLPEIPHGVFRYIQKLLIGITRLKALGDSNKQLTFVPHVIIFGRWQHTITLSCNYLSFEHDKSKAPKLNNSLRATQLASGGGHAACLLTLNPELFLHRLGGRALPRHWAHTGLDRSVNSHNNLQSSYIHYRIWFSQWPYQEN